MFTVVPLFRNFMQREIDILSEIDALIQSIHLRFFPIVQTYLCLLVKPGI